MKLIQRLRHVVFLGLLIACASRGTPTTTLPTLVVIPTATAPIPSATPPPNPPTPTATQRPTATKPTLIPTLRPTATPPVCLETRPASILDLIRSGALLFSGSETVWMLDRQGEITKLPFIDPVLSSVSPDGTTIGWHVDDGFNWWKTSGISGTVELPSSDTGWWWLRQWLADDQAVLNYVPSSREAGNPSPALDEFGVVSLSSGTVTTHSLTMSRLFGTAAQTYGVVFYPTYDPFLKYSLYVWQDTLDQWGQGMLLWDIEAQREAWILGDWQWPIEATGIDWRLDGSAVAITAHALEETSEYLAPEMIMVDTQGNATQLTDIYHSGRIAPGNFHLLRRPKWSPDGRYLAFVLDQENMGYSESQSGSLLIYDTVGERLLDYCIASVYYPAKEMIAWSPTSEQIAFSMRAKGKDGRYFISDVLVLDITTGQLGSVFDSSPHGLLRGWLAFDVP